MKPVQSFVREIFFTDLDEALYQILDRIENAQNITDDWTLEEPDKDVKEALKALSDSLDNLYCVASDVIRAQSRVDYLDETIKAARRKESMAEDDASATIDLLKNGGAEGYYDGCESLLIARMMSKYPLEFTAPNLTRRDMLKIAQDLDDFDKDE